MKQEVTTNRSYEEVLKENQILKEENKKLIEEINQLNNFLEITFEYVSILFDFSKERLKRLVADFEKKIKK